MDDRSRYSTENCSIARTLRIVGERWSLLVLREAFYGNTRFEQFLERTGCARNLLSQRLVTLVEHGILHRDSYREPGQRARYEYRLTDKGRDLYPVLVALMQWGDRYVADSAGPPVLLTHRDCGAPLHITLGCDLGHEDIASDEVDAAIGPGARLLTS
jgi:DNA-binding HxlR family transcriptional regulator